MGVDISAPLVGAARTRAAAEGITNASFVTADAQIHPLEPQSFDAVISRFGVMFFDDPVAAFANIRRGARRDARLAFFAWRSLVENEFFATAARTVSPYLPAAPPPDPKAPGQFAFADDQRVRSVLSAGGWSDIEAHRSDIVCEVGERDMMAIVTRLGPGGAALRQADQATAEKLKAAMGTAFARFVENGTARFTGACWLVKARA
jgi:SAM-dependent methyltransferase